MNSDYVLRPVTMDDLETIYHICARTGFNGGETRGLIQDDRMIGNYFAAPYLHHEPDACFVVDGNTEPAGYILGTSDTEGFNRWMNRTWLPEIRKLYPKNLKPLSGFDGFLLKMIHGDCSFPGFAAGYPGHLHIDLLPELQGLGWGRRLMDTFISRLSSKGCPGVHLAVGSENRKAIGFYRKLGYAELMEVPGALFLGLKINA
jgi:ribosomal protein S18 acetylase RimI-like enzyme